LPLNRSPTSSSVSTGSSFSISSILSRSDENAEGKEGAHASDMSSSAKIESSVSLGSYQPKHFSMERFHPYHSALAVSAFTRAGTCGTIQKGK
jgi:hypothetical protein